MKKIIATFICFIALGAHAQWSVKTQAQSFELDDLKNVYLVSSNKVEMYSEKGELLFVFNPSFTNRIETVDVSRALRPLVFYRDQGLLQYLDNTLSEQNDEVNLYNLPIGRIELVAASVDNHIWVFDSVNLELLRLDKSLQIVSRSGNLGNWISSEAKFNMLKEYQDAVLLAGPSGVIAFDLFGNFDHRITADPVIQMFCDQGSVYFEGNDSWMSTQVGRPVIDEVDLPKSKSRVVVKGNNLFVLNGGLFTKSLVDKE